VRAAVPRAKAKVPVAKAKVQRVVYRRLFFTERMGGRSVSG